MAFLMAKSKRLAWAIWMVSSVFYAYQYILRVMPSIMLGDIMQQFHIDSAAFGQFSGIYYIGYALMHLPIGMMLDRFGPRKVMTGCILLTVAGLLPLLFAESWIYPVLGRGLMGLGSSAAILGVFKIIRVAFDEAKFPRMLSLSVTIGLMGAIYGGGPLCYMREVLGYQMVIQLFALMGILLAVITYWMLPKQAVSSQETTIFSDIKEVLGNKKVIASCLFAGLMVGPLEGFADVWGGIFLTHVYGFEGVSAASLASLIFVGMCFGAPVLSFIADKVGSYLAVIIGSGCVMLGSFVLLLLSSLSPSLLTVSFVAVGVSCAYQILALYKASTYVRPQVAGLTTAVANMIIMVFGYGFHVTIGHVVNFFGGPQNPLALLYGTAVIPTALVIGTGGFIALWIGEKRVVGKAVQS